MKNEGENQLVENAPDSIIRIMGELVTLLVRYVESKSERRKAKLSNLCKPYIMGSQYNDVLLRYFVKIRFSYYGTSKTASVKDILREIERVRYARNIIITGSAGTGKSTVLKWLYLNADVKGYSSLYIPSRLFNQLEYGSFNDFLDKILETLDKSTTSEKSKEEKCVVYIDGLDELTFLKGERNEFDEIIDYFNKENSRGKFKFVISTRPEHFAFQQRIQKRDTKKSLDNYLVFQAKPLSKKESYEVCKSLEKLMRHEAKLQGTTHFIGKWPDGCLLSKRAYLKLLRSYLNSQSPETSLFSIPLLCRYAYPILCDWKENWNQVGSYPTINKSRQIQIALRACIKWEFHDFWEGSTSSGEGNKLFSEYEKKVNLFLSKVAGQMGLQDYISKKEWEKLSKKCNLTLNESYCILQEYDTDKISFSHASFRDYYMAMYYVGILERYLPTERVIGNTKIDILSKLLSMNSEFSIMLIEKMKNSKNITIRKIMNHISRMHNSEQIAEFARGDKRYEYLSDEPFTVKEYLSVFPAGVVQYNHLTINAKSIIQLEKTDILKVTSKEKEQYMGCSLEKISPSIQIRGFIVSTALEGSWDHTVAFSILEGIYGLQLSFLFRRKLTNEVLQIILENTFPQYFDGKMTLQEVLDLDEVRHALQLLNINDMDERFFEQAVLHNQFFGITSFLGKGKKYWCLFDSGILYVYEKIPQNEKVINELFYNGMRSAFLEYVTTYGLYRAVIKDIELATKECQFRDVESLMPTISAKEYLVNKGTRNILRRYYYIHWNNLCMLSAPDRCASTGFLGGDAMLKGENLLNIYQEVEEWPEYSENDKLFLMFSDEKLITWYLLGKGDEMVELAQSTMGLCEKYNHEKGIEFRNFLISDDISFIGADYQKVYEFCKKFIWI